MSRDTYWIEYGRQLELKAKLKAKFGKPQALCSTCGKPSVAMIPSTSTCVSCYIGAKKTARSPIDRLNYSESSPYQDVAIRHMEDR